MNDNDKNVILTAGLIAAIVSFGVTRGQNFRYRKTLEFRNERTLKDCKKAQAKLEKMVSEYKKNAEK